jgi:glycosyltransferase involved in cell wall biosynthesis
VKILHVIPAIAARYGGPSSMILPLCRSLNKLPGVEVELATTDADGPGGRIDASAIPTDFPVHVLPRLFSERWQYSQRLGQWLAANVAKYHLVHVHALWAYAAGAAARTAHNAGVPYIIRPAGMLSTYTFAQRKWMKGLYWWLMEQRTIKHAAAFHATSTQEAEAIRYFAPEGRIAIVPNGVEEAAWNKAVDRETLRQGCGTVLQERPIVLFLSRLHPKKGLVDLLLPAVARMRHDAVLAIGGGEDDRAPGYGLEVERAIQRLGLQNQVVLLGPVEQNRRWAMFDGADVFVLPSHSENFGIVVAEAMARGCPVIVTDAVDSSAHVQAASAGEVVPCNVPALASALDRVLASSERRQSYGEAARDYARQNFRWDEIAVLVEAMYRNCLPTGC